MNNNEMLYCLVAFILGWLVSRQMGNGFSVGAEWWQPKVPEGATELEECQITYGARADIWCKDERARARASGELSGEHSGEQGAHAYSGAQRRRARARIEVRVNGTMPLPPFLRRRKAKIYKQIKDIFLTSINNEQD